MITNVVEELEKMDVNWIYADESDFFYWFGNKSFDNDFIQQTIIC